MLLINVFVILILNFKYGDALFEYICKATELFKPYVHIYQGIKGPRLATWNDPGFYSVEFLQSNIYVCINGPAYLYYAKTTKLGEVYEAPQFRVYSHTCEMHNVKPQSFATNPNSLLNLKAIILLGDNTDYRDSFIQLFTAPYFFKENEYKDGFPAHYQNATSVVIIGSKQECIIEKGTNQNHPIVIKITTELPTPPVPPLPETDKYICKLGFSELLEDAASKAHLGPNDDVFKKALHTMQTMVNDEPFFGQRCATTSRSTKDFRLRRRTIEQTVNEMRAKYTPGGSMTSLKDSFNAKINGYIENLGKQMDELASQRSRHSIRLKAKLKELNETRAQEQLKADKLNVQFNSANILINNEIDWTLADDRNVTLANTTVIRETKKLDKMVEDMALLEEVEKQQEVVANATQTLMDNLSTLENNLSDIATQVSLAELLVEKVENSMRTYAPGPQVKKKDRGLLVYDTRSNPASIVITHPPNTPPTPGSCDTLPKMDGPEGECKKGKPDPVKSCNLFQVVMGKIQVWQDTSAIDYWKKDVLTMVSDIFVNACPYLGNRRKFVKLINLLMGHYITSNEHFNQPAAEGQSMACQQFKKWKGDQFTPPELPKPPQTNPATPPINENKEERPFWATLKEILQNCKEEDRKLIFKDSSLTYGAWKWVPPNATKESEYIEIKPYQEQAEEEYVFNWVIDMAWRIFATTLGICMPGYENKNPLISSRFHSLFTEDFLIPLRETWVNPKDNVVFQWILGEFYNGEAEHWTTLCMEASYMYAKKEDYRPLRSLLVNCALEHNYFTSGPRKGATGRFVSRKLKSRLKK